MVNQKYLIDIKDYQFNLKSGKINSIARLVKLGIPTVPFPHVLLPSVYRFYLRNKNLSDRILKELQNFFYNLQKKDFNVTVRPSIFAKIPGAEFIVSNQVNLPTFQDMTQAISAGYEKVLKEYRNRARIEFAYLIHGFYTANKAGVVFSEDGFGNIHIEAAFGENTNIFTRGKVTPDIYKVNKRTGEIKERVIAEKKFTLEVSEKGLKRVKLPKEVQKKPVFEDGEIKQIYEYTLRMERGYGPQEIECAVLKDGRLIFQSARKSQIKKQGTTLPTMTENIPIFLKAVKGEMIYLKKLKNSLDLQDKIVITDNLDIDFITKLVYRFRPKGMILKRGSLTAHAITILREARIPSVLASTLNMDKFKFVEIKKNGKVCFQ